MAFKQQVKDLLQVYWTPIVGMLLIFLFIIILLAIPNEDSVEEERIVRECYKNFARDYCEQNNMTSMGSSLNKMGYGYTFECKHPQTRTNMHFLQRFYFTHEELIECEGLRRGD